MRLSLTAMLLLCLSGCFSPDKTIPGRTAIDQQVTSAAICAAIEELDLSGVDPERDYWIHVTGPRDIDSGWVGTCLRRRMARDGFDIYYDQKPNRLRLEAVVDHAASDLESTLLGVPLNLPGVGNFGDVSLYKSATQTGRASIGLLIWGESGKLDHVVPSVRASRFFLNETYLTFIGSFVRTNLEGYVPPGQENREEEDEEEESVPSSDGEPNDPASNRE
ncbi:MAG: hypothetical protein AAF488_18835 [Planctomycetota bacterium]